MNCMNSWKNNLIIAFICFILSYNNLSFAISAESYVNICNEYFKKGQLIKARGNYQKALALNPKLQIARDNLAITYYNQGVSQLKAMQYPHAKMLLLKRSERIM